MSTRDAFALPGSSCSTTPFPPLPREGDCQGAGNRMWRFIAGEWVEVPPIRLAELRVQRLREDLRLAFIELKQLRASEDTATPNSVADLFASLGGPSGVGRLVGKSTEHAATMKRRGSIPVRYWDRLIGRPTISGKVITLEMLHSLHREVAA